MINTNNLVVISDLHAGCGYGLYPSNLKIQLDGGGYYIPSNGQRKVWNIWNYFWDKWLPLYMHDEPYMLIVNGDSIDGGAHHNNVTHITANMEDQIDIAYNILAPKVDKSKGLIMIRGTECHDGISGQYVENLSKRLGAIQYQGRYSRWESKLDFHGAYIHCAHTIGFTGSTNFESTAILAELAAFYYQTGRFHHKSPDIIVRSHRHACMEVKLPSANGMAISFCTAGFQLKTPFSYRLMKGRTAPPQIGGSLIRHGDRDMYFTLHFAVPPEEQRLEKIG